MDVLIVVETAFGSTVTARTAEGRGPEGTVTAARQQRPTDRTRWAPGPTPPVPEPSTPDTEHP